MPIQHYKDLFKNIQQNHIERLYFLYGEEVFVLESALTQLTRQAVGSAPKELAYSRLDNPSVMELQNETAAPPFMGAYRMVTVQDSPLFAQDANSVKPYLEILAQVPEYCVLVFVLRGAPDKRKALYKALLEHAAAVEFMPLAEHELTQYAIREASKRALTLDRPVAVYLTHVTQYQTQRLHHALQKLFDYCEPHAAVSKADVDAVVQGELEAGVFTMLDALKRGDMHTGFVQMHALLRAGQTAVGIIAVSAHKMRQVFYARQLLDAHISPDRAIKLMGGNPNAARYAVKDARRMALPYLKNALQLLARADTDLKSGKIREEALLLESLFLNIFNKRPAV